MLAKYQISATNYNEVTTDFAQLRRGTKDNITGKFQVVTTYDRRDNFGDPRRGI